MEKKMENEMETEVIMGYIRVILGLYGSESKRGACYIPLVARCRAAIKNLEYSWYWRACRARRAPVTYPL